MRNGGESRALLANRRSHKIWQWSDKAQGHRVDWRSRAWFLGTILCDGYQDSQQQNAGGGLVIRPVCRAARFVVDGFDLDTNVTQIAAEIADDISERSRTGKPPDTWKTELRRFF